MDKASDPPTEKCFSYCSLLLLVGVPLIMFVVFNEALTFNEDQTSASVSVFNAGHVSIRGHRAQYKTNITQLQTSNIQLKADLDALTNKQNALMKQYEEDNEGEGSHLSPSPTTHCNVSATTTIKNATLQREIDNLLTENQRLREKLSKSIRAETSLKQCQELLKTKAATAPPTTTAAQASEASGAVVSSTPTTTAAQASEASAPTTASKHDSIGESAKVSRPYWENKRLQGTKCSETPLKFYKNDVLMVGDSITRYLYFGLIQRICLHMNCSNLPFKIRDGEIARHRCSKHHTVNMATGFKIMYQSHHYGLSPTKIIAKERGTKDIVYWNTGLWMIADKFSEKQIINEYDTLIQEARNLCNQHKVKSFFVADNLPMAGGSLGNLDYVYLNTLLYKRWESAKLTTNEKICLKLFKLNWKRTTNWAHIQPDRVHPWKESAMSIAQELWTTLRLGKATMQCLKGDWLNIKEHAHSSLGDEDHSKIRWCKDYPLLNIREFGSGYNATSAASAAYAASVTSATSAASVRVRTNGQRKFSCTPNAQGPANSDMNNVEVNNDEVNTVQDCQQACDYQTGCVAVDYQPSSCRLYTVSEPFRISTDREFCVVQI